MEKDMFPIIKTYLEHAGYDVNAEVVHADMVATKADTVLIVEMKTSFTVGLIYQGLKRMHVCDHVYVAIPKPSLNVLKSKNFHEKKTITRRLSLGLMLVDMKHEMIEVLFDPAPYHLKKHHKKKAHLLKEVQTRVTRVNVGGINKIKIMTAYKELALLGLDALKDGPRTTRYITEIVGQKKIVNIMQKNYYGWFKRVDRGVYTLTSEGYQALHDYQEMIVNIINEKTES